MPIPVFILASGMALVSAMVLPATAAAQSAFISPIVGTWVTEPQTEITIEPCEEGFCGYITRVVVPQHIIDRFGAEQISELAPEEYFDYLNQDPELRDRPILGLQILTLVTQTGPVRYDGRIYNPEDGKTYDGYLEIVGPDRVRLTGCAVFNLVCRGEEWVRAPRVATSEPGSGDAAGEITANAVPSAESEAAATPLIGN